MRCFWAVVSLQTDLNLAFASPIGLRSSLLEASGTTIDTPWAMQNAEHVLPAGHSGGENSSGDVIRQFPVDETSGIISISNSHVQASVLLHRVLFLAAKWSSNLQPTELSSYMESYTWLDGRITHFSNGLPPIYPLADNGLVMAHVLVAAAAIRLHRPFSALDQVARMKCISASRTVLRVLRDTTISAASSISHANPVIGTICALACSILFDEIERTRLMWVEWAQTPDVNVLPAGEPESTLLLSLQEGMEIMGMRAPGNPLAEHQLTEVQQRYNSHYGSL
ncbi:hypothetical protein MSAN_00637800 [Mycena sanguinolenta]|uniref:Transcription factor domain-containing protein n=1 Tax=Mycena sanguinolenta TaxID=230812 RepID=A0A8H7DF99_9AGAR|nr:hypothetical protein MSAN_00637800 [Mycena sanguinolenta]